VTLNQALAQVERLDTLRRRLPTPAARVELADKLMEWCRGTKTATPLQQAQWLVDKVITELDEYPGPQTLHAMLIDRFYPSGPAAVYRPPEPVPIECPVCRDNGWIEDAEGINDWCQCRAAAAMRAELPGWLDTLNRHGARKPKPRGKLSTVQFEARIGL
jgi:hypothetical protein